MNNPVISVVMPAYNCAGYLSTSINSILAQTFTDFELIIINDGSTDDTEQQVLSFTDKRIVYSKNDMNRGLLYTLNRGVELATGRYIARMDGDDICLPERFQKQLQFLESHTGATIVTSSVELIDEQDHFIGYWEKEKQAMTSQQVRATLPKDNCIAHPTVMATSELFKKFRYDPRQPQAEDYDLWLRIAAENITIHKIPEVLIRHRILGDSFTRQRQKNVFWKNARTKRIFVIGQLRRGRFNGFIIKTFFYMLLDLVKGCVKAIKKLFRK
ncbi:MAG TPA: glycosyltransferase [Chitinophagaceae bacterium]|nr:glycosyltransferase [Chitinophagaceae bacterium]